MRTPVLAVDIGGTKIAAGLVSRTGEILLTKRAPMVCSGNSADGLQAVFRAMDAVRRDRRARQASAIGVSVPGWVDTRRGVLLSAPNIPCWRGLPLRREIENRYSLPVRISNDANAGALAEARWGAGAGYRIVFYVTLGTGIGTGLVTRGRIYSGRAGGATEGGHTTINLRGPLCGCGKRGCIEAYASGTAVARRARELLAKSSALRAKRRSQILTVAGGKLEAVTARIVAQAAAAGDQLARTILDDAANYFAIWLGGMIDLLEPSVIVLGGGFGGVMMSRLSLVERKLATWAGNPRRAEIPILRARYRAESALVGAASLSLAR